MADGVVNGSVQVDGDVRGSAPALHSRFSPGPFSGFAPPLRRAPGAAIPLPPYSPG